MIGKGSDFVTRNRAPVFLSEKHNLAQLMKCFIIASVNDETPAADELTIRAIGHIRSGKSVKFQALHQPDEQAGETSVLELLPREELRRGLQDLQGFTRIWLIWWFHRNQSWRSLVLPPRGMAKRRGVFATRSPHRPSALGMTPVRLLGIEGFRLLLGSCDLVDGTPVFDIKPYIPGYDAFPDESSGWLDEVEQWSQKEPGYAVRFAELAQTQIDWLRSKWNVDFTDRLLELLSRDPSPHRTRRIRSRAGGLFEIGCGAWRAIFQLQDSSVSILRLMPGFPMKLLCGEFAGGIPDQQAQLDFYLLWPAAEGSE